MQSCPYEHARHSALQTEFVA
eukprot:COSAG04_NODE_25207_length_310_cov_1.393365_1_plen_20_part_01